MSVDPSHALQLALPAALLADSELVTLLGGQHVYDPLGAPDGDDVGFERMIEIGEGQSIGDDNGCGSATEAWLDLHVWTRGPDGRLVGKQIVDRVREILAAPLELSGHIVVSQVFQGARHLTDPDGLTAHSVMTFQYRTRPST